MTIYSFDVLLFLFGTNLLFHVLFCYFLTCIQVSQEVGQVVWYSHLFQNFPQFIVIHTHTQGLKSTYERTLKTTMVLSYLQRVTVLLSLRVLITLNARVPEPLHVFLLL